MEIQYDKVKNKKTKKELSDDIVEVVLKKKRYQFW